MNKFLLIPLFVLSFFSFGQNNQQPVFQFGDLKVMTTVPGAGERKVELLANVIRNYCKSIENNQFDTWRLALTDSTVSRVSEKRLNNKFARLKGYGFSSDSLVIVSVKKLPKCYANELGTEYEIVLKVTDSMQVQNRVSFDHVKISAEKTNPFLIGINVIEDGKSYRICLHKYMADGSNKEENDGE